jgi:alpha-tubulin suppressor-like RCC1 family protein
MEKRTSLAVCLALVASLWMLPTVRAQDLYVTNLDQFVAEAYCSDHSIYLPFSPWDWRAYSIDGGQPWWLDCSQISCEGLFQTSTELSAGVPAYTVVLLQNVLTGETTVQPDGSSDVVATVAAPSGYQPVVTSENRWLWNWYEQMVDQPDVWGLSPGEIPPPTIRLKALLADVSNYATYGDYQSNLEAQAEAECAAQAAASSMRSGFTPMDDDDFVGGNPCTVTNLLQAFAVTNIARNADGSTKITWQSCQFFRYLVFSASAMSTNMQWVAQAYVWGSNGTSVTSWTDSSTTNNGGNTVSQRFYRVQRLLGSQISAGAEHSVVITPDSGLWAWGRNDGNLGDGLDSGMQVGGYLDHVEVYVPYPNDVANVTTCGAQAITNAVAVAAGGDDFTVVVDNAGQAWSFGENTEGQLGLGFGGFGETNLYDVPLKVGGLSNVVSVAAGFYHALALRADGTVLAWGSDNDGQLGVGGLASGETNAPVQSMNLTQIVAIAAGAYHSVALDARGNLYTFGGGYQGQLGNGATTKAVVPTMLTTISNVIAIAASSLHTLALTADKSVYSFGDNYYGELGRTGDNTVPRRVPNLSNVVAIAAGYQFSVAVTSDGQVYAFGDNSYGQLATNSTDVPFTNSPIPVVGISNAVLVAAPVFGDDAHDGQYTDPGGTHVLAMTLDPVDGTGQTASHYVCWGDNQAGEAGIGTTSGDGTNGYGDAYISTPTSPLQFCTRCQREVQLGTRGSFTAQCNGTLYLYFNGAIGDFANYSGSYTATVNGVTTNVPAFDNTGYGVGIPPYGPGIGVAVGTVT